MCINRIRKVDMSFFNLTGNCVHRVVLANFQASGPPSWDHIAATTRNSPKPLSAGNKMATEFAVAIIQDFKV